MKFRARFLVELTVIVSTLACLTAMVSEPGGPPRAHLSKASVASSDSASIDDEEQEPLIPQISRPIYRFAPIECRDAFSPLTPPRRCCSGHRAPHRLLSWERGRDPFRGPVATSTRRIRTTRTVASDFSSPHFRS
jgi:hypothetical protein